MTLFTTFKKKLKRILPNKVINFYNKYSTHKINKLIENYSNKEKFNYIYKKNLWGKNQEYLKSDFFSGDGSYNKHITVPYIKTINELFNQINPKSIVDLGCGDFNIGKNFTSKINKFYAIDIVKDLINYNKKKFYNFKNVEFLCLDVTKDKLPEADVCFLRQILQHLSNQDIFLLLKNIKGKYKYLIVTEHLPSEFFTPNKDMNTSFTIRLTKNSGIILDKDPFRLSYNNKRELLNTDAFPDNGVINTTIYYL